ncbi:MAG: RagB/SusD family nutrient uptake outer membrane protein, partial [Bacteroidales bacterium]
MKKYIIAILLIFSCLACQEDFLEEEAVTTLTQSFYRTTEGLEALVNGSYQVFRYKTDYNHGHYLFGAANDCEVFLHNNEDRISMGLYLPDAWGADVPSSETRITPAINMLLGGFSGGSIQIVEGMYPVINRCNVFLENFPELTGEDKEKVADSKGEILFIRAYSYYLLTNVLGDVPLILESFAGMPSTLYFPKSSMVDIYKVMIRDLREAVELLPETTDDLGRVTKPAAAHLLAKIYLNRAQSSGFENSPEQHLAMLFKGNVSTDLDSCIYYTTLVINQKQNETEFGGLAPDFADLWEVAGYVSENTNYDRDLVSEIILSTQYTFFQEFNGRYGCGFIHIYDQDYTVLNAAVSRDYQDYPRPFRAIGPNDWAYDMYPDRANDSRFWKTYIHEYASNDEDLANNAIKWDDQTAYYYNTYLKDKYPDRYNGDSAMVGESKIEYQKRALVYIENSKDEPVDSLWVASQPYLLIARWMACSPDGAGYVTKNGSGNITGFRSGAAVNPDNPVVTDVSDREVIYRHCVDPGFPR